MKRFLLILFSILVILPSGLSQVRESTDNNILFRGLVIDATNFSPIGNTQILINKEFTSVSGFDGTFSFYVNRNDTVLFKSLGYKPATMLISDTLTGREYNSGIFMNTDTLAIGEVIIVPRYSNLKSDILNAKSKVPEAMDNARYNVAISAYQGKNSQSVLGDPQNNYAVISQRQKTAAFEKGGIPSEHIAGISPLLLVPAAYLLIKGLPERAAPLQPELSKHEVEQIQKKYLETLRQRE